MIHMRNLYHDMCQLFFSQFTCAKLNHVVRIAYGCRVNVAKGKNYENHPLGALRYRCVVSRIIS